ncbi:MAG: hypothetical protein NE327_11425 [Lentisphaeraceae bacterium]|nr:hypothetical protein [Lentisphaeraceae bacterium]
MKKLTIYSAAFLLTYFSLSGEVKDKVKGITVTIPPGWVKGESKTGLNAIYKSQTPQSNGDKLAVHMFMIRVNKVSETDLKNIKETWEKLLNQQTEKLNQTLKSVRKDSADLIKANKFVISDIKIDGQDAFEMTLNSVIKVNEKILKMNCKSVVFLIDSEMYNVTANFVLPGEGNIEEVREKFLSSIKINAEK